jgi:hypothetical protein
MSDTVYRFLPWSRRGLSAALPVPGDGAALPARANVTIDVVVGGGAGPVSNPVQLHGPGDVIGLDPTVIVRTIPRPNATNVEPNYLVAVDFDQPELPWLFTPAGVPGSGHLLPWLVLVVVRDRPGVSVELPRGAVLPHLKVDSGAADELPDLADSWAWAHVQLLDEDAGTTTDAVATALRDHPNRNVSRLVCPRRLEPDARWIACLVPAFDAGVVRGLGGTPTTIELKPAWSSPEAIELPVYYHWNFQTGPQGDFESLVRRLKPYEASAQIGRIKMHVGDASPFVDLPPGDPKRFLDMDGALQAPAIARSAADPPVPDPALADVAPALRDGLRDVTRLLADAADGKLDGQAPEAGPALGPPLYGGAHIRRTSVTNANDTWFRELNTDPRSRVAAGLGAEVMKRFQEDVMEACWQQVGDVIAIEQALSRARLSLEAALRFRERHLVPMPQGRLLQVTAPLSDRTLLVGLSLPTAIAPTSLPDRTTDAAMRRYTSGRGRIVAGIARRAARDAASQVIADRNMQAALAAGEQLVTTLAAGRPDVDATRFPVVAIDGLPAAMPPADAEGKVTLERFGVGVRLDRADASVLTKTSRALQADPVPPASDLLRPRTDLRGSGMVTSAQVVAARDVSAVQLTALTDVAGGQAPSVSAIVASSSSSVVDAVLATAADRPGEAGFLIETGPAIVVRPLALRGSGDLVVVTPAGRANVPIARLDPRLRGTASAVGDLVGRLPNGAIGALHSRPGGLLVPSTPVELRPGVARGDVVVRRVPVGGPIPAPEPAAPTVTMPPLVKDAAVIARYEEAISVVAQRTVLAVDPITPQVVSFDLVGAAGATLERSNPVTVHPARLDTMVSLAGHALSGILADPSIAPAWRLPKLFDRVMAYPQLNLAAYAYLAQYDRTRFCPGVDEVPPESITLLETNPRFIAGFMGGLNHETNRELLWRSFPTDGRGTPWRSFWKRTDGRPDIFEIHTWGKRGNRDDLPVQTLDPLGNLALLVRGDLLRRYPNTMVIAVRAVKENGVQKPSDVAADLRTPVFAGAFDPDVSFFGFSLVSADLTTGEGWFFGLMEPVTEPRFGFDETVGRETVDPAIWNDVAWPDLLAEPGHLTSSALAALGVNDPAIPSVGQADGVAAALFQRPFKMLVHARHLVKGI